MSFSEKFSIGGAAFIFLLIVVAIGGWVENIIKLVAILDSPVTAMFIARIAGIFVAPLGVILGFC